MRGIALLVVLLALTGCGGSSAPKPVSAKAQGFPGEVVEADGHQVYFDCQGSGSPTVVFLNGHGEESSNWGDLLQQTAQVTRSCQYDRDGLGLTATYGAIGSKVRDAHDQVLELEQLLKYGGIKKPYVFVGHSWGGSLALLYAGTHGDEVKGVVLDDGAVPLSVLQAALPPKRADEPQAITELRSEVDTPVGDPENFDFAKSMAEAGRVTSIGDTPLITISAGQRFTGDLRLLNPVVSRWQSRQARLTSDNVHVLAPKSSHFVQLDAPDVVLAATRAVVDAVRNDRHLAPCPAIFGRLADARCLG
jgi:pimeloyl-ACP methyl ester carboxylesterase